MTIGCLIHERDRGVVSTPLTPCLVSLLNWVNLYRLGLDCGVKKEETIKTLYKL